MHIVLFSLDTKDMELKDPSSVYDAFFDQMRHSLRQSDVIARNSKNRFLVILLKTTPPNALLVIDRILTNWKADENCDLVNVSFEMKEID